VLQKVRTVIVDKTGTLTAGTPQVTQCAAAINFTESEMLAAAASLEQKSEHPLARAVAAAASARSLPVEPVADFRAEVGAGISGSVGGRRVQVGKTAMLKTEGVELAPSLDDLAARLEREGRTVVHVAIGGKHAGILAISDPIKPSSYEAVGALRRLGVEIVMLTGDNERTARTVARELGIDRVEAGLSPLQKQEKVESLRAAGQIVAMAGDGINDAPALAAADVGIAMSTGTDIAMESALVTLLHGDLRGIVRAIRLSRATMRNIRQNLFFAFIYNLLGVPIAAGVLYPFFGILLSPMLAAAAMSLSSVSVVANALRLRNVKL
jgi:Cu+-exporting ATPase